MPEICAKSILRVRPRIDSWFVSRMNLNLYRGCAHDCVYCDGRSERYRAPEDFAGAVEVKTNALAVLRREFARQFGDEHLQQELFWGTDSGLNGGDRQAGGVPPPDIPLEGRRSKRSGFLTLGGGVSDQYQPLEAQYRLARGVLGLCLEWQIPVHLLTKSALALRDLDLLGAINQESRTVVSVSLTTVDEAIARLVEPGAASPAARLDVLRRCSAAGIPTGVFLLPLLPGITDQPEMIRETVRAAAAAGASFVQMGGLTLKPGRQMAHYLATIARPFPAAHALTRELYAQANEHGIPLTDAAWDRWERMHAAWLQATQEFGVARRMPRAVFETVLDPADCADVVRIQEQDVNVYPA